MRRFQDCYVEFENGELLLGNAKIERRYSLGDGCIIPGELLDKTRNELAAVASQEPITLPYGRFDTVLLHCGKEDCNGLSAPYLAVILEMTNSGAVQILRLEIFPGMPFLSTQIRIRPKADAGLAESSENGALESLKLPTVHCSIQVTELFDKDDFCDSLLRTFTDSPYPNRYTGYRGDVFVIEPAGGQPALLAAKDAPVGSSHLRRPEHDLSIISGQIRIHGSGVDFSAVHADVEMDYYGTTIGVGDAQTLLCAYRRLLALRKKGEGQLFVMANTWGDTNCEKSLCEEFLCAELKAAEYIGVDVLQIDDGWEKGAIADPNHYMDHVWEGYHKASPDYWSVDPIRFPRGLEPVAEQAKQCGVQLGLWFSPDSAEDFANWKADAEILKCLHRQLGARYFKLDGVMLRSKTGDRNFTALTEELSQLGICLQLDVTAGDRFGYHYKPHYGILFVENRYTDNDTYFPYRTLRNLWMLSRVIPSRFLQFEVLNPRRNAERYGDDVFAPANYDIDYLFASVMASNPLLWCEMSHLKQEDAAQLRRIIALWSPHRKALFDSDISPIGEEPNGKNCTGFWASNGDSGYFILLREWNQRGHAEYEIPALAGKKLQTERIASNGEGDCQAAVSPDGKLKVHFSRANQYLFIRYWLC